MKNFLILSIVLFAFFACSDDKNEDQNLEQKDPIIGTWKIEKLSFDDGGVLIDGTNECTTKSTMVLSNDNTAAIETYKKLDSNGMCEIDEKETSTWENKGNNMYVLLGRGSELVKFEENNTKMIITNTVWRKQ